MGTTDTATRLNRRRFERFAPGAVPRWIRVYDNGGETVDRYTVVFTGNYGGRDGRCAVLAMSGEPFHPQGFCQHGEYDHVVDAPNGQRPPAIGRRCHLGKRVEWDDLPVACKLAVLQDYAFLWDITPGRTPSRSECAAMIEAFGG